MYRNHCSQVNRLIRQARLNYYSTKIQESDQKGVHKIAKHLMGEEEDISLPSHDSSQELAEKFSHYFKTKIGTIREELDNADAPHSTPSQHSVQQCDNIQELCSFDLATPDEIRKLILASPNKSCDLDPVPTWLVKACVEELTPWITSIVNNSLASGSVPGSLKCAHVRPLLKKAGMDTDCLKNYRPVSNIPFVAKILEKVVAARLDSHLMVNNMNCIYQSAYKPRHSTETALIKVHSDILAHLDRGILLLHPHLAGLKCRLRHD
jgi:hypothetical protein